MNSFDIFEKGKRMSQSGLVNEATSYIDCFSQKETVFKVLQQQMKRGRETTSLLFIAILVFFFVITIINFLTGQMSFLFDQTGFGQSLFSFVSGAVILYYFILWGGLRIRRFSKANRVNRKALIRIMLSRTLRLIGLRRPSSRETVYALLSLVFGSVANILILFVSTILVNGRLYLVATLDPLVVLQSLVIAPIFEELIYRGIYLGMFLEILGRSKAIAVSALIMSSFTFGWIHPSEPLVKTLGAVILGFIYLYSYKKNLLASICAHFGLNLVGIYLVALRP